jgi:hypothetical protein
MRYLLPFFFALSALASDPLQQVQKPAGTGWTNQVGVPGGIPPLSSMTPILLASGGNINTALSTCPSNSYVQLATNGTYNLGGTTINIFNDGVGLNGAPGVTFTSANYPDAQIGNWQWWGVNETVTPSTGNHTNWTAGYSQGTTQITVAGVNGYAVGQMIVLDQNDDVDTDIYGNSSNGPYSLYEYTSVSFPNDGRDRAQFQVNYITAINGTTITLREPLYMTNWNNQNVNLQYGSSQQPQVWRFNSGGPVRKSWIANCTFSQGRADFNCAVDCWMSNVVVHLGTTQHTPAIYAHWTLRCQIDHCTCDATAGLDTYGFGTRASAGILVQNNISRSVNTGLYPNGSHGGVWAYNVMTNQVPFFTVILQGLLQHGGNPNMNLYEGNYSPAIGFDNTWGGSSRNVAFRSRTLGYNPSAGTGEGLQYAFAANVTNRYECSIGNVLGTTGITTNYEDYAGQAGGCKANAIYYLGWWDVSCNAAVTDLLPRSTLTRAYNWTSATATNSGIVPDGFASADLPPSYYLASKPAWFGFLAWPAVDPASPAYSSSYTNIPAGYRDVYGVDPPAGGGQVAMGQQWSSGSTSGMNIK